MRTGTSSLPVAKLSPPVQPRVVSRPRLFRKIDRGRQLGCVWIAGPAGAGKTTLVASYLEAKRYPNVWYRLDEGDRDLASVFQYLALAFDRASPCRRPPLPALAPDHQHDLPTFVRRFFERAGARLRTPLVLVFDNYQDVAAEAALHELLPVGVSALPRHVAVVIVSRDSPPPSFASLEVGRGLTYVSPDDLTLTAREMSRLVSLHVPRASRRQALELRRSATLAHGWAAGAVLLLEQARTGGATDPGDAAQASPTLFSYLAKEVVARLPEECQTLLLKTCVLPEMTTSMAVALSERPSAKEHLARLYRTRNFTERVQRAEPWYRFHPLFRAALLELTKSTHTETALRELRQRGAALFNEKGLIDEALGLLIESASWPDVVQQILGVAPTLLQQGRFDTLAKWIERIPAAARDEQPWLTYWLAVARLPFDPIESARLFRQAFVQCQQTGDLTGAMAAWGGAAASIVTQMGDFSELDPLLAVCPFSDPDELSTLPTPLAVRLALALTSCLIWRAPGQARTERWVTFVGRLWNQPELIQQFLPAPFCEIYHLWKGDIRAAKHGIEVRKATMQRDLHHPRISQMYHCSEAVLAWMEGEPDRCRQAVSRGLDLSRREGTHNWDSLLLSHAVYNELFQGNFAAAEHYLELVRPPAHLQRSVLAQHYRFLLAWLYLQRGEFARAWDCQDPSISCSPTVSGPFAEATDLIVSAYAARGLGNGAEAERRRARIAEIAESMDSDLLRFAASFVGASLAFDTGRHDAGLLLLKTGLSIGCRRNLLGFLGWHGPSVAALCAQALHAGIEVEYVLRLLRTRWLPRPPDAESVEIWPWPIRIRTLGRFSVEVDGTPLPLGRKAPHRQFDLLKQLVASGGRGVPQQAVMDALWPDSDGDTARETLDKTLQRLRRLLGHQGAIPGSGGRLSLNRDLCWVDALAFENLADRILRNGAATGLHSEPQHLVERAAALYRGPFLATDVDAGWATPLRHRLDRKYRRLIEPTA